MSKELVLVMEENADLMHLMKSALSTSGFDVLTAQSIDHGLEKALEHPLSLIIIDLTTTSGANRFEVLDYVNSHLGKSHRDHIPVIFIMDQKTRIVAESRFDIKPDEFLTKPFKLEEFIEKVKYALNSRTPQFIPQTFRVGKLELDDEKQKVTLKKKPIELSFKEYQLLKYFLTSRGKVLTRDFLLHQIWDYDLSKDIKTRTVDIHIFNLRKKLKAEGKRIITVKRRGYRFEFDN